jgi:hypothetical protein
MIFKDYASLYENGLFLGKFCAETYRMVFNNRDIYFRVIHTGAELVLLVMSKGKRYGFEFTPTRWRRNIILKA